MSESHPSETPDVTASAAQKATLQRMLSEAQAQVGELTAEVNQRGRDAARLQTELEERMQAYRKLQRRADQDRAELIEQKDQLTKLSSNLESLQAKLSESEAARAQTSARLIRTESELKELRRLARETGAAAEPPPAAASLQKAESETNVVDRASRQPETVDHAYAAFCDALCEYNRLQKQEAPAYSPELGRRLGHAAAALAVFEESVERGVLAILEELGTRQPGLHEHLNVLQYLRGGDRAWWRSVADPGTRHRSGDRRLGMYLVQLAKMNFSLLTAYHRTMAETVADRARELLNPIQLRKKAGRTRPEELWGYFEESAAAGIPALLGDACRADLAKTVDQLYRFGADVR